MKMGVVGAGLMGAEIGFVFALAGWDVVLSDRSLDVVGGAKKRLLSILEKASPEGCIRNKIRLT